MKVMCDDVTTIYVDGEEENMEGTGNWNEIATLDIPRSTRIVAIKCHNRGGPYGIMVRITDEEESIVAVSDNSWNCCNKNETGWYSVSFEEDESWKPAAITNKQDLWTEENFSPEEKFFHENIIWTASGEDDLTVFCRKVLSGDVNISRMNYTKKAVS